MILVLLMLLASDSDPIAVAVPVRATPVSYAREVADLLDGKCTGCHGDALSESKLKLTSVPLMLRGGKRGPAIVVGKADDSLLFRMAAHRVKPVMPPKDKPQHKPLTPAELGLLKLWIDAGAKDDSAEVAATAKPIELGVLPKGVHPVVAVDITSDGKRVAVGRANIVQVYEVDSGLLIATLGGHKDIVQSLRFRPDGRALAAGSYQIVTRWNLPLMAEAKTLAGHAGAVRAAVATADGSILYSTGEDRTIRAWDVAKGKSLRLIATAPIAIGALALTPDGQTLAAGGFDGTIRLYPVQGGRERVTLRGPVGPIEGLAFFDGGKRLASAGADGLARLWTIPENAADPLGEPVVIRGHTGAIHALAASPDGQTFATGGEDRIIHIWKASDGTIAQSLEGSPTVIRSLAYSLKGDRLAAGFDDGIAHLIDASSGQVLHRLDGLKAAVSAIAFSPSGERVATATARGGVKVWDNRTGQGVAAFGHMGDVQKAGPTPPDAVAIVRSTATAPLHAVMFLDETSLATASAAKTVKVWTCEGTWSESSALGPHAFRVLALDYSPDGRLLATGGGEPSRSGEVKVWDATNGTLVRTLPESLHSDTVFSLAFSPDGKSLASAGADKFVKVTNVADGKEVRSMEGHAGHVMSVDWSEDGKRLVSGGADNVLKLWEFESGDQIRTFLAAGKQVTAVRWGRGKGTGVIVGASGDKLVRFWNPTDGTISRVFNGPDDYVYAVALSKDRARVAAGGADGVLFLWNGETGQLVRRIEP